MLNNMNISNDTTSLDSKDVHYDFEIMDKFPQYNLQAERIVRNGKPTNYQLIVKDNEVVQSFTKNYKVIPNELVKDVADEIAENHGLIPASQMDKSWQYHLSMPDTFYGRKNGVVTAMTSVFVNPEPVNMGTKDNPDLLCFGVAISNSIDGTQSLKGRGFSFRQLCGNQGHHFLSQASMTLANEEQIRNVGRINTATIAKTNFVHRRSLNINDFSESIGKVLDYGKEFFKTLERMQKQKLQKEEAQLIAKMPKAVWDNEKFDWMTVDKLGNVQLRREPTKYEAWNSFTDVLSHSTKIGYNGIMRYQNTADAMLVRTA